MKVLVTGADGFIGRNLCTRLESIRTGKDCTHPELIIEKVYAWRRNTTLQEQRQYCRHADFVFHLAGINRPKQPEEYQAGNPGLTEQLLRLLKENGNTCPIMLASSIQASLCGKYADSDYGKSKLSCEEALFQYAKSTGAKVLVYRFPNVFGKWCRPNYNSVIATFCYNIAREIPIQVNDANTTLDLLYIDDLIEEMLAALGENEHHCCYRGMLVVSDCKGNFCYVPTTHRVSLGEIAEMLTTFHNQPQTLVIPEQPENSLQKKLYVTYLSYLPKEKIAYPLKVNTDQRGCFIELFKSKACGQVSVNISKPGIIKGQHWHHTKWEFFVVVSGHGLIQERKVGSDEILEFEVWGKQPQAVHMLPGYTHNIINLSDTEDLVTVMWANELFDPAHPDTYHEEV